MSSNEKLGTSDSEDSIPSQTLATNELSATPIIQTKIMIDTTFLFDQYQSRGIGMYGKQILRRLIPIIANDPRWDLRLIGFNELETNLMQIGLTQFVLDEVKSKVKFHSMGDPVVSNPGNIRRWYKHYKPIIEDVRPDIFFATHFERGLPSSKILSYRQKYRPKTIVVAHDAIPLVMDKFSSKSALHNFLKRAFYKYMWEGVKNADLVITCSNFSRGDILKYTGISEEKVETVYLGVDEKFYRENSRIEPHDVEEILTRFNLSDQKYFLYDAGLEENKGTDFLLKIFRSLIDFKSDTLPDKLVILGNDFVKGNGRVIEARNVLAQNFIKKAKDLNLMENIITTGRVTDEELKVLLFNAKAYINFSQYEGFSFGPVQAMAAEVPAIASNTSCTPETTNGGALLVDVTDTELAAKKIKNHLENSEEVMGLIKKGREVVEKYRWEETASKTWELIQKVALSK